MAHGPRAEIGPGQHVALHRCRSVGRQAFHHPSRTRPERAARNRGACKDDPRLAAYARLLLGQANLAENGQLPDPAAFTTALGEVMLRAV
jgi:hypothetical protein